MVYLGIDIGSTSAKTILLDADLNIVHKDFSPTGLNSNDKAQQIRAQILDLGHSAEHIKTVATGYGRVSVPFADKTLTEISCHARGASHLFATESACVIDIGGQDTKVIRIKNGRVIDFLMNDKCSAGTGQFLSIMADTLQLSLAELCEAARSGGAERISSMCTVFAQSEVVSLIGHGKSKEDIAYAVIDSLVNKVKSLSSKMASDAEVLYLTGGLCELDFVIEMLSKVLEREIRTLPDARYAGAIGAALYASELK